MLRFTLLELAIFLSPFVIYGLWRLTAAAVREEHDPPWATLSLIGGALAIIVFFFLAVTAPRDGREGDQYVPPRLEGGQIRSGRFENAPPDDAAEADTAEPEEPGPSPEATEAEFPPDPDDDPQ